MEISPSDLLKNKLYNPLGKIIQYILDVLFPSFCIRCKKEGNFLCENCKTYIIIRKFIEKPKKYFPFNPIYAALNYRDPLVSSLIINLKYNNLRNIHIYLAHCIITHLKYVKFKSHNNMIITYIPLHRRKLAQRGFNQSELIAHKVADILQIPFLKNTLKRKHYTISQIKVAQKEKRLQNITGVFSCPNTQSIKNKTIILIDDVMTTGATLGECAKTLKQAGAKKIIGIVVAR